MCRKLTRQQWYNQRITCIGHFYAEQGVRYTKPEIVQGLAPAMTIDDFMSVVPHWADNNKRAAFMELVKNWVGENPDFKAVSDRNKANRGNQGTHTAGSSSTDRYRERLGKKLGRELGEMEAWTHMKLVTPRPNEPRPAPEMYYGKAKENKERYCEEYAKLPVSVRVDWRTVRARYIGVTQRINPSTLTYARPKFGKSICRTGHCADSARSAMRTAGPPRSDPMAEC
nr:uncharacterized protein LOC127347638 [Lolium perenne]